MTTFLFANNTRTTLASPIGPTDTVCSLAAGTGAKFPNPGAGQQFVLSFFDAATAETNEIAYCTARTGDVCTIVRGREGTTAGTFAGGDFALNFVTAGTAAAFLQGGSFGTMSGQDADAVAITGGEITGTRIGLDGGATGGRPATPVLHETFFDTTLDQPIWCTQISPPIWVNAAGIAV